MEDQAEYLDKHGLNNSLTKIRDWIKSKFVSKAGDTMTGELKNTRSGSTTWIKARDSAAISCPQPSSGTVKSGLSLKTANGSWDVASYKSDDTLRFVYASDSNYSSSTNTVNQFSIPNTGILGIANGGTGVSSSPSMLTNLATTNADTVLKASPRPGVTGTLPVGNGGTGVTTNAAIGLKAYPVGAIYISYVSTSPASLFGGTWSQITGKVLRAANDVNTGGSDTVTLTTSQIPSHNHGIHFLYYQRGAGTNQCVGMITTDSPSGYVGTATQNQGSGGSHSNLPAYQNLYVWRRTA